MRLRFSVGSAPAAQFNRTETPIAVRATPATAVRARAAAGAARMWDRVASATSGCAACRGAE